MRSRPSVWSAKFFHENSGRLQYLESPLILLGTAAAEAVQYGNQYLQAGSSLHGTAFNYLSASNSFLSILPWIGIIEGGLTLVSGLSILWLAIFLADDDLPDPQRPVEEIRDRFFYQGLWDVMGSVALLIILSAFHMPALGFAIINTMDLMLGILVACLYEKFDLADSLMKIVEAAGWWSLLLFSANPIGLGVGSLCLAATFAYKAFAKGQAIRTLIADASEVSSCRRNDEDREDHDDADHAFRLDFRLRI